MNAPTLRKLHTHRNVLQIIGIQVKHITATTRSTKPKRVRVADKHYAHHKPHNGTCTIAAKKKTENVMPASRNTQIIRNVTSLAANNLWPHVCVDEL